MSDARLRELERRWRREASAELFSEFAAACARAGLRAPPAEAADAWAPLRLALGARLGDPDARRALGLVDEAEPDDAYAWVRRLEPSARPSQDTGWHLWGKELFVRVAAAAVRATAPACRDSLVAAIAATTVDRLERWAATGATHGDGERERQALVSAHLETMKFNVRFQGSRSPALLAMTCACSMATSSAPASDSAGSAALHASLLVGVPAVVAAVRRELVPWALFARS